MTLASPAITPSRLSVPLRFALRDLRGGLRGFYVFIACIALGVMAIAGVNSFASSLGDGLAREGRTILGGDLSFTLIHREADATERAFLERAGRVSATATMRAMARTVDGRHRAGGDQGGRRRVPAVRRGAARSGAAAGRCARHARRRVRRRRRSAAAGAARSQARRALHDRRRDHRNPRRTHLRAGPAVGGRLRPRTAADDQPGSLACDRPVAAGLPGALALSSAAAGERRERRRRGAHDRTQRPRKCRMPAGRCAAAATLRPGSSATSSASRNISRWSASPRCWSAASAWRTRSAAISTASATPSPR